MTEPVEVRIVDEKITPEKVRKSNLNPRPESQIDISHELINVQTGRGSVGKDIDKDYEIKLITPNGEIRHIKAWDFFTTLSSDVRLSNLTELPDKKFVKWGVRQQLISLQLGLVQSSALCNALTLSVTEPSLASNGFLRNIIQTIKQESQHVQIEQNGEKRNILGFLKPKANG
jgi:hypothetical protein